MSSLLPSLTCPDVLHVFAAPTRQAHTQAEEVRGLSVAIAVLMAGSGPVKALDFSQWEEGSDDDQAYETAPSKAAQPQELPDELE